MHHVKWSSPLPSCICVHQFQGTHKVTVETPSPQLYPSHLISLLWFDFWVPDKGFISKEALSGHTGSMASCWNGTHRNISKGDIVICEIMRKGASILEIPASQWKSRLHSLLQHSCMKIGGRDGGRTKSILPAPVPSPLKTSISMTSKCFQCLHVEECRMPHFTPEKLSKRGIRLMWPLQIRNCLLRTSFSILQII